VGAEGLEPLKGALCANTTLHTVCLASCRMGEEGGVAMAEVIEGNAKLQRLDLRRNDLGVAGLMAIRLSMKTNKAMQEVAVEAPADALPDANAELQAQFLAEIAAACHANTRRRAAPRRRRWQMATAPPPWT